MLLIYLQFCSIKLNLLFVFNKKKIRFVYQKKIIMAKEFTTENFTKEVLEANLPVLVDFWAEWCGPCRMISPLIDELHADFKDQAVIGKVNVDSESDISAKYGITSIPTLLFFKDGEIVDKHVGSASKSQLEDKLKSLI